MSLPTGFEGILLHGAKPAVINPPIGFKGIVLSYSGETLFVNVKNGLGRPVVDVEVRTTYSSQTLTDYTKDDGSAAILCDDTSSIIIQKGKYWKTLSYNRATDGNLIDVIFQPYLLE